MAKTTLRILVTNTSDNQLYQDESVLLAKFPLLVLLCMQNTQRGL